MLNEDDILQLININDKEKINQELKSFKLLDNLNDETKKAIAYEVVALANKNGGMLILGVGDSGIPDGKLKVELDKTKGLIQNICRDKISPQIEFDIQFIEGKINDFIVVYIPKRKSIPHAYIGSRENTHEIKNRLYYTRTPYGKKLMTDTELEWAFSHTDEPDFSSEFRLKTEFNKDLVLQAGHITWGCYKINNFLDYLSKEDKKFLLEDYNRFSGFIVEIFPYFLLRTLSEYFTFSWYIGMSSGFGRESSGPMKTKLPVETKVISIHDIQNNDMKILNSLEWDFKEVLNNNFAHCNKFHVPPETEVSIKSDNNNRISILFRNPAFTFEILIARLSSGAGLHPLNPDYKVNYERFGIEAQKYSMSNFLHFDGAGFINANFEFLEYDTERHKMHLQYYNSIKKLVEKDWDFIDIVKKLPDVELRVIHSKVSDILEYLKR